MHVKILGIGCANCHTLERRTQEALDRLGLTAELEKVTDMGAIAAYGVMRLPALVMDERVIFSGRVPQTEELVTLLGMVRS
jgi:small redox-active disulfide protein 2